MPTHKTLFVSDRGARWTGEGQDFETCEPGFFAPTNEVGGGVIEGVAEFDEHVQGRRLTVEPSTPSSRAAPAIDPPRERANRILKSLHSGFTRRSVDGSRVKVNTSSGMRSIGDRRPLIGEAA
jgi:hypothetical protein